MLFKDQAKPKLSPETFNSLKSNKNEEACAVVMMTEIFAARETETRRRILFSLSV
jgi:hypothetical protein